MLTSRVLVCRPEYPRTIKVKSYIQQLKLDMETVREN